MREFLWFTNTRITSMRKGCEGMKHLKVISENCTGCLSCMLACSFKHFKYFDLSKSRISVSRDDEFARFNPTVCILCEDKYCVESCPVGALSVHPEKGYILLDDEKCVSCKVCVSSCPYDGVKWDEDEGKPLFCDMCGGDPECVKHCKFAEALIVVP